MGRQWAAVGFAIVGALGAAFAACSFGAPGGSEGDGVPDAHGSGIADQRVDDVESDFAMGTLTEGVVAPRGAVEPMPYASGRLVARGYTGYSGNRVVAGAEIAAIETMLGGFQTGTALADPNDPLPLARPLGLSFRAGCGECTVLYDGELDLPAGDHEVRFDVDDDVILEVTDGAETRRLYAQRSPASTQVLHLDHGGWNPVRLAFHQEGGTAKIEIKLAATGANLFGPTTTRARLDARRGLVLRGLANFSDPRGSAILATPDFSYPDVPTPDLDVDQDRMTLRLTGQLFIADPGMYSFDLGLGVGDHGRLWLDDHQVAAVLVSGATGPTDQPTGTIQLGTGWHSILIDHFDTSGDAILHVTMGLNGAPRAPIPTERLRPVPLRGLTETASAVADVDAVDGGTTTVRLRFAPIAGSMVELYDESFSSSDPRPTSTTVRGCSTDVQQAILPAALQVRESAEVCARQPIADIAIITTDAAGGGRPRFTTIAGLVTYHGGSAYRPFADRVTFISRSFDTPGALGLTSLAVTTVPDNVVVDRYVRTAASPAELEDAPWTPTGDDGSIPGSVPGGAAAQYKLVLHPEGWVFASVEQVTLAFDRAATSAP